MKRNKIVLCAIALFAAFGSAYAVKTSNVFAATVYKPDAQHPGQYILTNCNLESTPSCDPATVTVPNSYFTYSITTGYQALPVGTPLKRAI